MRRGRRRRDQRGAAAVEAALITPVLLLMVFGMIEMAFLMKDNVAVASATRVGARIASAQPAAEVQPCTGENEATVCVAGSVPGFVQAAASAMRTNGSAIDSEQIEEIWVYDANADGLPGTATDMDDATCAVRCVRFTWSVSANTFLFRGPGTWSDVAADPCLTAGKRVGVRLVTDHTWVVGFDLWPGFPDSLQVDDHAVMSFEPLSIETCR